MGEEIFSLPEEDSHYITRVQRKSIGYSMDFLDSSGNQYKGTLVNITDNLCQVKLTPIENEAKDDYNIIVFQGIPKGKKIDLMIRQSVEVGVKNFYPIIADHSVPSFKNNEDREKKHKRWEKIVKEASQQSGSKSLTSLEPLQTLSKALEGLQEPYTGIFFHQVPLMKTSLHGILKSAEKNIVLVIGPEGGLSQNEVELLKKYNFTPALLGDNILRAETATTFSLGAVKMILLERDLWKTN